MLVGDLANAVAERDAGGPGVRSRPRRGDRSLREIALRRRPVPDAWHRRLRSDPAPPPARARGPAHADHRPHEPTPATRIVPAVSRPGWTTTSRSRSTPTRSPPCWRDGPRGPAAIGILRSRAAGLRAPAVTSTPTCVLRGGHADPEGSPRMAWALRLAGGRGVPAPRPSARPRARPCSGPALIATSVPIPLLALQQGLLSDVVRGGGLGWHGAARPGRAGTRRATWRCREVACRRRRRSPITCWPRGRSSRSGAGAQRERSGRRDRHPRPAPAARGRRGGPRRGDEGRGRSEEGEPARRSRASSGSRSSHARRRSCVASLRRSARSVDARGSAGFDFDMALGAIISGPARSTRPTTRTPDRSSPRSPCVGPCRPARRTTPGTSPPTSPSWRTRARSSPG